MKEPHLNQAAAAAAKGQVVHEGKDQQPHLNLDQPKKKENQEERICLSPF